MDEPFTSTSIVQRSEERQRKLERQREANKRFYERNREITIEKVRLNQLRKQIEKMLESEANGTF
jgi:hypothetical protein